MTARAVGTGGNIEALDEGISLTTSMASIDFVGAGVTASNVGDAVTVTIPGGGTPGGAVNSVQFNNAGAFDGFGTWTGTVLTVPGGLNINTTTEGVVLPRLTTVQRNALTDVEGTVVYDTDDNTIYQNDGSAWSIPGAGLTTLQSAYDNSLGAVPMVLLDGVPTPMTFRASVAGAVLQIQDVGAANTIFEVDADPDTIVARAGVTVENSFTNAGSAQDLVLNNTFTQTGAFVGGGILSSGTVTTGVSTTWIWALLQESKLYRININPAFAAFTLFNAIASIENQGNFNLVQGLILNNGLRHARRTAGTSTTVQTIGLSNSPQTATTVAGAVMTRTTGITAVSDSPTWNTVAGSTINLGTVTAVRVVQPAQALFGSSAGTENITARIGLDWINHTFGSVSSVIRSNQAAGTNRRFLNHTGTALSTHNGNLRFELDLVGNIFGASQDFTQAYAGGTDSFFFQHNTAFGDQLHFYNPDDGRYRIQGGAAAAATNELTLFFPDGIGLGDQSGTNGNQFLSVVTGASSGFLTPGSAGDYSGVLLTHAQNYDNNGLARSRVSAWVINGFSYQNSTGTVTNADTLTVGGMVTSAPGVTITTRQSINVIAGRSRFQSAMQYNPINPAALSAGNNNDWAGLLTGTANNGMRHWVRVTPDGGGTSVITGIDATNAQDGDCFKLTNIGTVAFDINHNDGSSLAGNRILTYTVANLTLTANESVEIIYDATTAAWRVLYGSAA